MSAYVPGDAALLLDGTPVFGSVAEIDAAGGFAREVAADVTWYAVSVHQAQLSLGDIRSEGVAQIRERLVGRLTPGANTLHRSAGEAKRAFEMYAAEVDRIHVEAGRIVRDMNDHLASIRLQVSQIEDIASLIRVPASYAWNEGPPGVLPEPQLGYGSEDLDRGQRGLVVQQLRAAHEQPWLLAASQWRSGIEGVETAIADWAGLIDDRRRAETRLVAALDDTAIGQFLSVSASDWASRRFAVATAISGELWGTSGRAPAVAKAHPLLVRLLGTESGEHVWDSPPEPEAVAAAWTRLNDDERRRLIDEVPWVIGNLPGLPFGVRDEANRKLVAHYQAYPQQLAPDQLKLMAVVCDIVEREAGQKEEFGRGLPLVQIVAFDMTGEVPKVAVSYGDLDAASHATWEVPGMNNDAHRALASWDEASRNLYMAQENRQQLSAAETHAVVAWLGYDTPDLPSEGDLGVLGSASAAAGSVRFSAELDGAHAARGDRPRDLPAIHVLAHSYGTTLATIALTRVRQPVQSLTMLGSAGLDTRLVQSLDELHVREVALGQKAIYTTHASGDQLAPFGAGTAGRGQPNPHARDIFGAHLNSPVYEGALSFSSEGDPLRKLKRTDGHSTIGEGDRRGLIGMSASEGHGYMDLDTQSLESVAQITMGQIGVELDASLQRTGDRHVGFTPALPNPAGGIPLIPLFLAPRETLKYGETP